MAKTEIAGLAIIAGFAYLLYKSVTFDLKDLTKGLGENLGHLNPFTWNFNLGGQSSTDVSAQSRDFAKKAFDQGLGVSPPASSGLGSTFQTVFDPGAGSGLGSQGTIYYKNLSTGYIAPASVPTVNPFKEGLKGSPVSGFLRNQDMARKIQETEARIVSKTLGPTKQTSQASGVALSDLQQKMGVVLK